MKFNRQIKLYFQAGLPLYWFPMPLAAIKISVL